MKNNLIRGIMKIAAIFVLGLLIGWIVEWIIDWFHWRGRMDKAADENTQLREHIITLENELNSKPVSTNVTLLTDGKGNDNFQLIKGIGPAFSKRLSEAGVTTFEQLAGLTPQQMEQILGTLFKRFFAKENTILAQAREFAEQKAKSR